MGTVGLGLAQVGTALAQAKEIRRKEELERIKTAIEQGQLGVSQRYTQLREKELGMQAEREKRLAREANQPKYLGHIVAPDGSLLYGIQSPDGQVKFTKLPYSVETDSLLKSMEAGIETLPSEVQPSARAAVGGMISLGRLKEAQTELDKYLLQYGKSKIPSQITIGESRSTIDPFTGETTTRRTTQKVPAKPGAAPVPKVAVPPAPKPQPPLSPAARAAGIKKLQWNDVAPSPGFYDSEGQPLVPRQYWSRVDEMAKALRDGTTKIPAINPRNFRLWTAIMARSRELGWTGGPPPTTNERDAAQWARKALEHVPEARDMIAKLDKEGKLGPLAGRYSEFMSRRIGVGTPEYNDYVRLADTIGLLSTALMRAHVGARGGVRLLDHFEKMWDSGKMDASNLNAGIDVLESFLRSYSTLDQPTVPGGSPAPPKSIDDVLDNLFGKKGPS